MFMSAMLFLCKCSKCTKIQDKNVNVILKLGSHIFSIEFSCQMKLDVIYVIIYKCDVKVKALVTQLFPAL